MPCRKTVSTYTEADLRIKRKGARGACVDHAFQFGHVGYETLVGDPSQKRAGYMGLKLQRKIWAGN